MHPKGVSLSSSVPRCHTNELNKDLSIGDSLGALSQSIGHTWIPLRTTEPAPRDILQAGLDRKAKDLDVASKTGSVAPQNHLHSLKELAF